MKNLLHYKRHSAVVLLLLVLLSSINAFAGDKRNRGRTAEFVQNKFASGRYHNAEIRNGVIWTWGQNTYGQLGDGTHTNRATPVQVLAGHPGGTTVDNDWVAVSVGDRHSIALKSDGTLWAWGYAYREYAIEIGVDDDWVSITTGYQHSAALKSNGTLWHWGGTYGGPVPSQINSWTDWISISANDDHTMGLRANGSIWGWGGNAGSQLGDGTNTNRSTPVQAGSTSDFVSVNAGRHHTMAIKKDGTLWAWGLNNSGQLGIGASSTKQSPVQVGTDDDWMMVAGGAAHSAAIKSDGTLWTWGLNPSGQLGNGTTTNTNTPAKVGTSNDWVAVKNSFSSNVAIKANGTLWFWGNDLFTSATSPITSPIQVGTAPTDWIDVKSGNYYGLGIKADGSLWAWGQNIFGQLGDNTTTTRKDPVRIGTDNDWVKVAPGRYHSVALKADGTLWAWGQNTDGQVGDGTTTTRKAPVKIGTSTDWVDIAAGVQHTLAIKSDGTLWAWGNNGNSRLGDGTTTGRTTPVQIGTSKNWVSVSAGNVHSMALQADGSLWGWGSNSNGQLGDGSTTNSTTPKKITANMNNNIWVSVETAFEHSIGLQSDGSLWAWGNNSQGQLGDGTTQTRTSPRHIALGINDWVAISSPARHGTARRGDGTVWAWGVNSNGELGDGTTTDRTSPVQCGSDGGWAHHSAGYGHTQLVKPQRQQICGVGRNHYGQLGHGTTTNTSVVECSCIDTVKIITQPASTNICKESNATFSVATSGTITIYQWQINTGSGWTDITNNSTYSGATTGTLSIAAAPLSMNGYQYRVFLKGTCILTATSSAATLTLLDSIPPTITAPNNVSVNVNEGTCIATGVTLGSPTTSDNCGVDSIWNDAPASYTVGNTIVTWSAKDVYGNINTATQTVTVVDNINPTITAPSTAFANIDTVNFCSISNIALGTPTTSDNCGVDSVWNNAPTAFPIGSTFVTWTVRDVNGNTATATQQVVVRWPEMEVRGANIMISNNDSMPSGGNNTLFGTSLIGGSTYNKTYQIRNGGISSMYVFGIDIVGDSGNNFTLLPTTQPISMSQGTTKNFTVAFTGNQLGTHTAWLRIRSNDCDEDTFKFLMKAVIICVPPQFTSCPNVTANSDSGQCSAVVTYASTISGGTTTYTFTGATTGSGSGNGSGATFNKGVTNVQLINTNQCGADTCSFTVTVSDNESPVVTPPADVDVVVNGRHNKLPVSSIGTATATDNCVVTSISNDAPANGFGKGTRTVTWTAIDADSNVGTATQIVKVRSPRITLPGQFFVSQPISNGDNTPSGGEKTIFNGTTCSSVSQFYDVVNNGDATLRVDTIYFTGDAAADFSVSKTKFNLGAGNHTTFTVTMNSTTYGTKNATVNIVNNDTLFTYAIRGNVHGPELTANGNNVDIQNGDSTPTTADFTSFGDVLYGTYKTRTYVLRNDGDLVLSVSDINLTGADKNSFKILGDTAMSIAVNSTHNLSVEFMSTTLGQHDATINVISDDCDENPFEFAISANVTCTTAHFTSCPADITLNANTGQCSNSASYTTTVTANPAASITYSFTGATTGSGNGNGTGSTFNAGVTNVQVVATNACGSDTCNFTVTVVDNQNPSITVVDSVTVNTDSGQCSATNVALGTPVTSDNCGIDSIWNDAPTTFAKGTTTVTWIVRDFGGNTDTATQIVTVVDDEAPVIVCADSLFKGIVYGCDVDVSGFLNGATISDNCGVASKSFSPSTASIGGAYHTVTAIDSAGNISTKQVYVVVTAPEIDMFGVNNIEIADGDMTPSTTDGTDFGAVYQYANKVMTYTVKNTGEKVLYILSPLSIGNQTNGGGFAIASNPFPATLSPGDSRTFKIRFNPTTTNQGVRTAIVSLTSRDCDEGTYNFKVSATADSCSQLTLTAPTGTINRNVNTAKCYAVYGFSVNASSASEIDYYKYDLNGATVRSVQSNSNTYSGQFYVGTTIVRAYAYNKCGNFDKKTFYVTVTDNQDPFIRVQSTITADADNGQCYATNVNLGNPLIVEYCGVDSVWNNAPATFPVGTTTVIWTVTDIHGNSSSDTQEVVVTDNQDPTITCPANLTVNADNGQCSATNVSLGTPTTADNCGVDSVWNDAPTSFALGTTTVTWIVKDIHGNTDTCTQTVTVIDNQNPTITAPAAITANADNGKCSNSSLSLGTPTTSDNCGVDSIWNNAPDSFSVGTTTVTWTVADVSGNTNTATQNVTVVDNQNPMVFPGPIGSNQILANKFYIEQGCGYSIVDNYVTTSAYGTVTLDSFMTLPGYVYAGDNCGIQSITHNAPDTLPIGNTNIKWTAKDYSNNIKTFSTNFTVYAPEIVVKGNNNVIDDGDTTPTVADNTDFGDAYINDSVTKAFVIQNLGAVKLKVLGATITGANASEFSIASNNGYPKYINPSNTDTVYVKFSPNSVGTKSAGLVIENWDCDESTYNFSLSGNALCDTPVFTVAPANINTNQDNGQCNAVVSYNATATSTVTPTYSYAFTGATTGTGTGTGSGNTFNVGTTNVVVTATGVCATETHSFNITVTDNQDPVIVAPANVMVNNNSGTCQATNVSLGTPTTSDNCGVDSVWNNAPSTYAVGTTTVTWTVLDIHGNNSSATQNVVVTDNQAPTITAPTDISTGTDSNNYCISSNIVLGTPTTADNCGVDSIWNDAPATFPVGNTTVTWTVKDIHGNMGTDTQVVHIKSPDIQMADTVDFGTRNAGPGNKSLYINVKNFGDTVLNVDSMRIIGPDSASFYIAQDVPAQYTVQYARPWGTSTFQFRTHFSGSAVGTYNATLLVYSNDCDENPLAVALTGEVICVPAHITSCPSDITINSAQGQCNNTATYSTSVSGAPTPTLTYNFSGATTGSGSGNGTGLTFNVGTTYVQIIATNDCNTDTCNFTVSVTDNENPTITCPTDVTVNADSGVCLATNISLGTPTTSDNCGVDSVWNNAPASYSVGTTSVTWTVTDIHGNSNTCTQTVTVVDNQNPTIACPADVTVNANNGQCAATNVSLGTPTASDNCGVDSIWNNAPASYSVGTTTVTWTVTDIHGNSSSCTQTVTVIDNQNPTIACPADVTVNADNGQCTATTVSLGTPTTSDNCGVDSVWNNAPASYSVGTTSVTWTVIDVHGNNNTCTQTVTVIDNQNPTIACPADVTVNADNGTCAATNITLGTPTTSDNCGVDRVWNNAPSSYPVGTTTVTWMVIDIHGNSSSCTQTVTVVDNQAPIANCKNYIVTLSGGTATISPSDVDNGSTDNCGIETMSLSKSTFTCSDAGDNQVVLTVYDIHGNSSTCTATVTVPAAPSVSITTIPSNNTYTGGNPNQIFLGYGPQSATLSTTSTGGNNFSYAWSPATGLNCSNCQSPVFAPTSAGNYTYTVTATNDGGCSATSNVSFCVLDVQEYKNNGSLSGKIYVCIPKNNGGQQTKAVQPSHVQGHLQSGGRLGKCEESCGSAAKGEHTTNTEEKEPGSLQELATVGNLKVYPNPNSGTFTVELPSEVKGGVMAVRDMLGKEIKQFRFMANQTLTFSIPEIPDGMYMVDIKNGEELYRTRVIIKR
ncbi:MAG: HYR domain-containing protein [Chitinophagales bacterium]|nr:HYR domain-containing protein [Chitinophagales bacterium]